MGKEVESVLSIGRCNDVYSYSRAKTCPAQTEHSAQSKAMPLLHFAYSLCSLVKLRRCHACKVGFASSTIPMSLRVEIVFARLTNVILNLPKALNIIDSMKRLLACYMGAEGRVFVLVDAVALVDDVALIGGFCVFVDGVMV